MRRGFRLVVLGAGLFGAPVVADNVRVTVEVIEVRHEDLSAWMADEANGARLHAKAVAAVEAGDAEVVDTSVLTVRDDRKASVASLTELIYPMEMDVDALRWRFPAPERPVGLLVGGAFPLPPRIIDLWFRHFETRNTGVTLELFAEMESGAERVELIADYEAIARSGISTWTEYRDPWGSAAIRTPDFRVRRWLGSVILVPGRFELWTVFTPEPAKVPASLTRQMAFVRAEVLKPSPGP